MNIQPLILIHDLGGSPEDWRDCGLEAFLVEKGGLDLRFIRRFDFGYQRERGIPCYDSQGNILELAHRLSDDPTLHSAEEYQVGHLARESADAGGPDKVTLIALGAGGLIARYYLSRRIPDRWGTHYTGGVDRLILIGTPNLGACFRSLSGEMLRGQGKWRWLKQLAAVGLLNASVKERLGALEAGLDSVHRRVLDEMSRHPGRPISLQTMGTLQASRNSFLVRWLNRHNHVPANVKVHCVLGDITLTTRMRVLGRVRSVPLRMGDLIVSPESAATIKGPRLDLRRFEGRYEVDLSEGAEPQEALGWFGGDLPPVAHTRLVRSPEVHQAILNILSQD